MSYGTELSPCFSLQTLNERKSVWNSSKPLHSCSGFNKIIIYAWIWKKTTHHMIKHSHKYMGHTVQRTASIRSPSFCSCLSVHSPVWEGQCSSYTCRWSCRSRLVPSRWFQCVPADTFLQDRHIKLYIGLKETIQPLDWCPLTETGRHWSPEAIRLAKSGRTSHEHEARATGVPHHRAHPPVVTKNYSIKVHIWPPTVHCDTKERL